MKLTIHKDISIVGRIFATIPISLLKENHLIQVGARDEELVFVPLLSELSDSDYLVHIPSGIDEKDVKIEIDKFNMFNKKYKIIQQ